ncbi:beta-ketoacyl synthase N-terminal-like domain-containing protein [Hymenobacter latericus]|uniref:beta-ketoacyl synthase N-terminal-like domain-containing protein n=1 Tax=Hymenobacter sp. YIM 151858-1 TaxID=2987688 RepID=UPI002226628C|nr:beta-ketoacyl synthase N-terminal-like domain-containing protein [Hymenobacter sp. YIM 151858-1]UYZ60774.1 beta-ketoacyl-ACP reductase [Hymenobacter sp. YIM 151858-1]
MTDFARAAIIIRGRGSVSALGTAAGAPYSAGSPFSARALGAQPVPVGSIPAAEEELLQALRRQQPAFRQLDRTVLLGLLAARAARTQAGWISADALSGNSTTDQHAAQLTVSIGSSRGATGRFEEFHNSYLTEGSVPAAASPLTTLGNVASWVAFDAGSQGAALSHSSTCSSAFQALGNAVAWLRAGMAQHFLAGGTEAPLTNFTLAQMQALGIYSPFGAEEWPCRPGAGTPNTFVLGEGAAVFALERLSPEALQAERAQRPNAPLLVLEGVGFGFEAIPSKTGLSPDGQHFQRAMRGALQQANCQPNEVDALVLHSPGTAAGDAAERRAVQAIFGEQLPACTSNKWLVGHTLGASAALSLHFACELLLGAAPAALPFASWLNEHPAHKPLRRIMVNAAGFGGNAASAIVSLA